MKSLLKLRSARIRIAEQFEASANDMLAAVRQQQLEGVIGKRMESLYEPGKRTGSWVKCRVNRGQELVIGGYIPGPHGFDSLIVGYYRGKDLVYVARVRNGFVPASRRQVFEKIRPLVSPTMPFVISVCRDGLHLLASFVMVVPSADLSAATGNHFLVGYQSGRDDSSPYGDKEKYEHSKWHVHR
jgi:ATP-dependent DNA ligase